MYPAMLNINNQSITIIGGGKVAYRKAKAFLEFGGKVRVISKEFNEKFKQLEGKISQSQKVYSEEDLVGSFIVVAATNDQIINEAIGSYCRSKGILCNVIDNRELSSFIVPAYVKQGELIISISTNGKSPSLARRIKKELSEQYDENYIEYLEILGGIREKVLNSTRGEEEKKSILRYISGLDLKELQTYEKEKRYN